MAKSRLLKDGEKENFSSLSEKAERNIKEDREKAKIVFENLVKKIENGQIVDHCEASNSLVKAIEAMQKSNEQLIKIAALTQKEGEEEPEEEFDPKDYLKKIKEEDEEQN